MYWQYGHPWLVVSEPNFMQKIAFSREMGFTRAEFDRILPSALNNRSYDVNGSHVTSMIDGGTMQLIISEQKFRKIASISLPYLCIDFSFEKLTEQQVEQTMLFFDLRYQRGGG